MSTDAGEGRDSRDFISLPDYREYPAREMIQRVTHFREEMERRRTTRHFSDRPVSREVIEECIRTAGTAPSGAHQQPWHFVAISDAATKRRIRESAEEAERDFYATAPAEWLAALAPLGTDAVKPYLESAPWLIVVFAERYGLSDSGDRHTHYYVQESVGIATGFLLAAIHQAGLVSLTHTPNPMDFLRDLLGRPTNERPMMIVVAGYPADDAKVPAIERKGIEEISTFMESSAGA